MQSILTLMNSCSQEEFLDFLEHLIPEKLRKKLDKLNEQKSVNKTGYHR